MPVLGTGIMGRGWITQCAMTGHEVHCYDASPKMLAGVVPGCEKLVATAAKKVKNTDPEFVPNALKKIVLHEERRAFIDAAGSCDVFLEVVYEDLKLKCEVLAEYLPQLPESVVFWSNSSSLDIDPWPRRAAGRTGRS